MNAILAAILSFFIPGLGQALSGEIVKGIVFFIIALILVAIVTFLLGNSLGYIIDVVYSIYVAYDAYVLANT